jgi:hypothetical protein
VGITKKSPCILYGKKKLVRLVYNFLYKEAGPVVVRRADPGVPPRGGGPHGL